MTEMPLPLLVKQWLCLLLQVFIRTPNMDGFSNSNGDSYNGQYKQFVNAPSVEIKFERETYNDVNNVPSEQYGYGDQHYQPTAYTQPYSQGYNTGTDAGLQPVQVQAPAYFGSEMTPISSGGDNGTNQDFTSTKVSPNTYT